MYRPKSPFVSVVVVSFLLAGFVGLLPIEFVISALIFALVIRGGLQLIRLATAESTNAKEFDQT
jgi:hypothetical protein